MNECIEHYLNYVITLAVVIVSIRALIISSRALKNDSKYHSEGLLLQLISLKSNEANIIIREETEGITKNGFLKVVSIMITFIQASDLVVAQNDQKKHIDKGAIRNIFYLSLDTSIREHIKYSTHSKWNEILNGVEKKQIETITVFFKESSDKYD